jgi:PAS domain S-box-containing protein
MSALRSPAAMFRDLSLNWKVTVTLAVAFASIVTVFLLALLPFEREQRRRLRDRDQRLVSILREKYQRDLIYDVLSENEASLAVDLADLARQAGAQTLAATGDRRVLARLAGEGVFAGLAPDEDVVLLVRKDGGAELVGPGGRPVRSDQAVAIDKLPRMGPPAAGAASFEEVAWGGDLVLRHSAELRAAEDVFGRLELLYSMAELRRSESLTRTILYGVVGTTFLVALALLNLLMSRIVVAPVRRVLQAMRQASRGDLDVRLPAVSRDEVGTMAESFNHMVADLASSKREVEDYSHNLEDMVLSRTRELRDSEEQLRQLKNHLETVIAHVATGVLSLDEQDRVTTLNDRAAEILGLARSGLEGRPVQEVLADPEAARLLERIVAARNASGVRRAQLNLKLARGRRTLSVVASSLPGEAGRRVGTVVVFDDLTEILASQRLAAWKEAVERVIHEIKNPLTPVGLAAQTLRSAYAEDRGKFDELFPSAIDMILRAVKDLKELISEFTRFSRLPQVSLRRHDVNALVAEALSLYVPSGPPGITVRQQLGSDLPPIEADPEQLKRVLLNVINNGIDAMEGRGGELTVFTGSADGGGQVRIAVRDQGSGIEDVERIFEPYYTTKVKGTGLGLLISRQIVEEHGGEIRVRSELGVGTEVEIRLPAASARDRQAEAQVPSSR